jgi:hypothetical protein
MLYHAGWRCKRPCLAPDRSRRLIWPGGPKHDLVGRRDTRNKAVARAAGPVHVLGMFTVSDAQAAAIRTVFAEKGELSAALELRRLFPGITDNIKARQHARTIVGWTPRPMPPCTVTRLHPRGPT